MKASLSALADLILSFPRSERVRLLTDLLLELSETERVSVLTRVAKKLSSRERKKLASVVTAPSRLKRLDSWLESVLAANPDLTPKRAALMARNYFRYDTRMLPFLIAHARRVKARLRMREKQTAG